MQRVNKNTLKSLVKNKTPVQVEWIDIVANIRADTKVVNETPVAELMSHSVLYGVIYKYDNTGIVVANDIPDDNSEIDYTVMSYGNIVNINKLSKRR